MNHYRNLGLPNKASKNAIEHAYHRLTKKYHSNKKTTESKNKLISINESYEYLMKSNGYKNLKSTEYHENQKSYNNFDLNGDGKLSLSEYRNFKNHKLEEAARGFYNLHETSFSYRIELAIYYGIDILICLIVIALPIICFFRNTVEGVILGIILFVAITAPALGHFYTRKSVKKNKTYIKIIRKRYDAKFKILGIFWF